MTAPTCHDLPTLIDGEPATVWTWGDREGECTALGGHDLRPACEPQVDQKEEAECG
jgi:hypothetical protein